LAVCQRIPFNSISLCLFKNIRDAAFHDLEWQGIVFAQFIPKPERARRILVNEQALPRLPVHMGSEVSGQRAFARAALP
jgi:hypothetical protein